MKFYRCEECGKIVVVLEETAAPTVCCGDTMKLLKAGAVDAAVEKHVPVCKVEGNTLQVSVGSVAHPMLEEHSIKFICVETNKGYQIKYLNPGETAEAEFALAAGETPVAVYEFCNLHGLWKTEEFGK